MPTASLFLIAPLLTAACALLAPSEPRIRPRRLPRLAPWALLGALLLAALALAGLLQSGPGTSPLLGMAGVGLSERIDAVSVPMFLLVAFVGWVVLRYSATALDGEPRQAAFTAWLCLTLAAVFLLVLAGNLGQLLLGWIGSSLCLHRLLLFYPERPLARRAARKKFLTARIGDLALVAAAVLMLAAYGSADIATILAAARAGQGGWMAVLAASLLTVAALLKSAQFPSHGWLTEVMDTPTPVSALLHAGVINAGGFLLIRFADLMLLAPGTLAVLVMIGGFTALFGCLAMLTQAAVKTALAWSTVAQMGFMMVECGLGLFPLALLHILAHSLYKAHAFLASGGAVETIAAARRPGPVAAPDVAAVARAFLIALVIYLCAGAVFGFAHKPPQSIALGAILIFGVAYLLAQGLADAAPQALTRSTARYAVAASISYFALQVAIEHATAGTLPPPPVPGPLEWWLIVLAVLSFGTVAVLQSLFPWWSGHPAFAGLRVHVSQGLYANAAFDRWLGNWRRADAQLEAPAGTPAAARAAAIAAGACDGTGARALPLAGLAPAGLQDVLAAADSAAAAIPPAWPLAATVAVNPFLGQASCTLAETGARLARAAGVRLTLPRARYREQLAQGHLLDQDLSAALAAAPVGLRPASLEELKRALQSPDAAPQRLHTVADLAASVSGVDWPDLIAERFGAWASGWFDAGQALWSAPQGSGAYAAWRAMAIHDLTPEIIGLDGFAAAVHAAPERAAEAVLRSVQQLQVPAAALESYFHQLLCSLGGWAQYARHQHWQAQQQGVQDPLMLELLAIRLFWEEVLLQRHAARIAVPWAAIAAEHAQAAEPTPDLVLDAILQEALERAAQRELAATLGGPGAAPRLRTPLLQAAFCIDVRSERFRRALESLDPDIQTLGFAGFFGITVAHRRFASLSDEARLPVLLAPALHSCTGGPGQSAAEEGARIHARTLRAWGRFKQAAVSSFAFVEASGPLYAFKLLRASLARETPVEVDPACPHLAPQPETGERIAMALRVLRAMSLTDGFARVVVLVGHGAQVVNNPFASALQCGACGGHSGEVNARVLAGVLNDPLVRAGLDREGVHIPAETLFVGALHDTTSDAITLFDGDHPAPGHTADLRSVAQWFAAAGQLTRTERALGLPGAAQGQALLQRGRDWAQLRPEWGLAGCQAFIAAPRARTAGRDLGGRAFLHDYDWQSDAGFGVLELILTAPTVVASWISLQYYGSSVAPSLFGAGNKLLHNVTGGIGVVEGNGGLLRTGLPWQSVHDGEALVHTPLRLTVCIEAPREAIAAVLDRHPQVRALFDQHWLHLFALDASGRMAWRYAGDLRWRAEDGHTADPVEEYAAMQC